MGNKKNAKKAGGKKGRGRGRPKQGKAQASMAAAAVPPAASAASFQETETATSNEVESESDVEVKDEVKAESEDEAAAAIAAPAPVALMPANTPRGRGRPRKDKSQATPVQQMMNAGNIEAEVETAGGRRRPGRHAPVAAPVATAASAPTPGPVVASNSRRRSSKQVLAATPATPVTPAATAAIAPVTTPAPVSTAAPTPAPVRNIAWLHTFLHNPSPRLTIPLSFRIYNYVLNGARTAAQQNGNQSQDLCLCNEQEPFLGNDEEITCAACNTTSHKRCYGYLETETPTKFLCYSCLLRDDGDALKIMTDMCALRNLLFHLYVEGLPKPEEYLQFESRLGMRPGSWLIILKQLILEGYTAADANLDMFIYPNMKIIEKDGGVMSLGQQEQLAKLFKYYFDPTLYIKDYFDIPAGVGANEKYPRWMIDEMVEKDEVGAEFPLK